MNREQPPPGRILPPAMGPVLLAAALLLAACGGEAGSGGALSDGASAHSSSAARAAPRSAESRADLTRLVVLGDSLGAMQNSCMLHTQTVNLYPSLIAAQAGVDMPVPLVSDPGFPACLELRDGAVVPSAPPGVFGWRINVGEPVYNLSVPGTRVQGALNPLADIAFYHSDLFVPAYPYEVFHHLALGLSALPGGAPQPQTMVEWAIALEPTTLIVWLGANDVLWAALKAGPEYITGYGDGTVDPAPFAGQYRALLHTLRDRTDAAIVVANIPDVTVIPFITPAGRVLAAVAEETPLTLAQLWSILGLAPGDYLTPEAPQAISAALDAFFATGLPQTLPDGVVFTAGEVQITRDATAAFNQIIADTASEIGAPVVDAHALLNRVDSEGYVVNGQRLTTEFLGGVFTLDGIHPTNTGQAVVANEFIGVLNGHFAAGIPPVNVEAVAAEDPLVFPWAGRPPAAFQAMTPEAAAHAAGAFVP